MFTAFGVIALVLAALGVYAVISYLVAERGHELAIRLALGATGADLRNLVVGETLSVAAWGVSVGWLGSILLARGIRRFLFGISPVAPEVYVLAAMGLIVMALAATWMPLRRATAVEPTTALRAE